MVPTDGIYQRVSVAMVTRGTTEPHAQRCVAAYRTYLDMYASDPSLPWVPTREADAALHMHLTMDSFDDDCVAILGHTIWHDPDFKGTPAFDTAWARSAEGFRARGVEIDPACEGETCSILPSPKRLGERQGVDLRR